MLKFVQAGTRMGRAAGSGDEQTSIQPRWREQLLFSFLFRQGLTSIAQASGGTNL